MLRDVILCSNGDIPADLVIKKVKVVNVFTEEIIEADIGIKNEYIARVGETSDIIGSKTEIHDGKGYYAVPAFIDAHIHIESSLLSLTQFAKAVIPHGTAGVITDFHELANVLGLRGLKMVIDEAKKLPLHVYMMIPSCVPAAPGVDTPGASIGPKEIQELFDEDLVIGLGEMMNYPGAIRGDSEVLEKILMTEERRMIVDGHAPLLLGKELQAYRVAGPITDHESTTEAEAIEKLRLGMYLLVRYGSALKNIDILKIILRKGLPLDRCILVSDDKHVSDILSEGHLEDAIKKAIELGVDPVKAIKMVTINVASAYRLSRVCAIAPGYFANIVLVDDLKKMNIKMVFLRGKLMAINKRLVAKISPYEYPKWALSTINLKRRLSAEDLVIRYFKERAMVRVMVAHEGSAITEKTVEELKVRNGIIEPDPSRDVLEIVVVERHKALGNIGIGFIKGFELRRGAIASSIAHDSHNIISIGTNRRDIATAINAIAQVGGGICIVDQGIVKALLELPLAGLMSIKSPTAVSEEFSKLEREVKDLGIGIKNPFMTLSFMALPVIPKLKITDKGLFDVEKFKHVPVIVEE